MKKLLFVILMLFAFSLNAQTSIYHPFPDSDIIWREEYSGVSFGCCCSGMICLQERYYELFLAGDTLINSVIYKKILMVGYGNEYISGPWYCSPPCPGNYNYTYYYNIYCGGLRQDTSQRKVFYADPYYAQDTLLYDFNLSIGDTLPDSWGNSYPYNFVSSIDSVLIGNDYHKRFWLTPCGGIDSNYVSIIEGIGSDYGLLAWLHTPFESGSYLLCVTIDSATVYPDTSIYCQLETKINEIVNDFTYSLFPNPFHNFTTLQISSEFENAELKIYDLLGNQVRCQVIHSTAVCIERDALQEGIYFIQAINEKGSIISKKLIIE